LRSGLVTWGWAVSTAVLSVSGPRDALAHGRLPEPIAFVRHPTDPSESVIQASFGLLLSRDDGQHWGWICEEAADYSDDSDPPLALTADGTLLVGTFTGLQVSHDACAFRKELEGKFVTDVATDASDPHRALVLVSTGLGGGEFETEIFATDDDGATFARLGAALPSDFVGAAMAPAPSDPAVIYVSGVVFDAEGNSASAVHVTSDGGATWARASLPGFESYTPYVGVVHPTEASRVWMRVLVPDETVLLYSDDGAQSFTEVLRDASDWQALTLSLDGSEVFAGGRSLGIVRASTETHEFAQVSEVGPKCLEMADEGLYACAREAVDGFSLGLSVDGGESFEPRYHLACVDGPVECTAGTSAGDLCPVAWPPLAQTLDVESCAGAGGGAPETAEVTAVGGACCSVAPGADVTGRGPALAAWATLVALVLGRRRRSGPLSSRPRDPASTPPPRRRRSGTPRRDSSSLAR
jgi:MYXO-CTERM domain-containing protein